MKKLFAVILTLALLLSLTAATAEEKTVIRYSKSQGPYTELFEDGIIPILEKQGYTLEVVEASDLLVADKMLEAGDVDVNVEQHTAYIETYFNANNDGHLVGISPIPTVPEMKELILMGARYIAAKGLVGVHSDDLNLVVPVKDMPVILQAYKELSEADELPIRVHQQCRMLRIMISA